MITYVFICGEEQLLSCCFGGSYCLLSLCVLKCYPAQELPRVGCVADGEVEHMESELEPESDWIFLRAPFLFSSHISGAVKKNMSWNSIQKSTCIVDCFSSPIHTYRLVVAGIFFG